MEWVAGLDDWEAFSRDSQLSLYDVAGSVGS